MPYYQCEKCGAWYYSASPEKDGEICGDTKTETSCDGTIRTKTYEQSKNNK